MTVGRVLFSIAILAFGVQQFLYGDFIPGRAPAWPQAMPGQIAWAYLSGATFVACGLALLISRAVRGAAWTIAALIFAWALLRHLPDLVTVPNGILITFSGKALALVGGAIAIGAAAARDDGIENIGVRLGALCLGIFMVIGGVQHFIYPGFVAQLVPAWIPGATFWTYFAGVALICGGIGMQINRTARLASTLSGLMILSWVFVLHLPRAFAASGAQVRNEWVAVFEALAFAGVALFLGGWPGNDGTVPSQRGYVATSSRG